MVRGLTTAACLCMPAGVGLAVGSALYVPAAAVIIIALFNLVFFKQNDNLKGREYMMQGENTYDLFITDQERNIILEEKSIAFPAAEKIIRDYPWREEPQSHAQIWQYNTRFSFSLHYLKPMNKFEAGFSDKVSRFKLPLPHVGATYGHFNEIDEVFEPLQLFYEGEFEKLEQLLVKHRPELKGD